MKPHEGNAGEVLLNGSPRATDRVTYAGFFVGILGFLTLFYLIRDTVSFVAVSGLFLAIDVTAFAFGMRGNRRRRPARIILSPMEIQAQFRDGRTRSIPRDSVDRLRFFTFLGDTQAVLHHTFGRWEDDVHIYGEAALQVKRWFDSSPSSVRGDSKPNNRTHQG